MKSINILSFLLLSTTLSLVAFSHEFSISDNNGNIVFPPVLDMDGEYLKIDEEYSIISALYGGGSVYLADIDNRTECPNDVLLDSSGDFEHSTPVLFYTMQLGSQFVSEDQDVSIMFSTKSCFNETVWQAGDYMLGPIHPPPRFVITGGTLGFPGPNNIENCFKIEKYEKGIPHSYKLRYCPS
ncbi:cysteine protease inhibitor 1-like [Solanum stenotomum]|uniref:cysteine protease inhibitor 1-like n=1 Tax=Solanum stenotomum TaxID=172797 RepID=UPI0020D15F77|nr:cysteine protease inhibitor 1-like [Solanum stenotomum]